jgi:hypothetical protein
MQPLTQRRPSTEQRVIPSGKQQRLYCPRGTAIYIVRQFSADVEYRGSVRLRIVWIVAGTPHARAPQQTFLSEPVDTVLAAVTIQPDGIDLYY